MRIARSISPCRRKRFPSAKCRSIVCGSTLTTSMKDSIALSGCSFKRKFSPRKYDRGSARDSRSRCEMSIRAAIQPSAKNSTGIGSSHQRRSKSITRPSHAVHRSLRRRNRYASLLVVLAAKAAELSLHAHVATQPGEESRHDAKRERDQQQEDQRGFPREPVVEADGDQLGVLERHEQQRQEEHDADGPADETHLANPKKERAGGIIVTDSGPSSERGPAREARGGRALSEWPRGRYVSLQLP